MDRIKNMVDMKKTPEEIKEGFAMPPDQSVYPYGLCLSLCQDELERLGFDPNDFQVNDMVHFHAMATVTSVSTSDNVNSGSSSRVELQITHMSAESEDDENKEEEKEKPKRDVASKLYKS